MEKCVEPTCNACETNAVTAHFACMASSSDGIWARQGLATQADRLDRIDHMMVRATAAKSAAKAKAKAKSGSRTSLGATSSGEVSAATSRASSPSPGTSAAKALVGRYTLEGLATDWDNQSAIRARTRENLNLCVTYQDGEMSNGYVEGTPESIKLNHAVLQPIVLLMKQHKLMLPCIDNLIQSVDEFYQIAKQPRSLEHCYQQAWAIRRMLVKLKRCLYREIAPQDCTYACVLVDQ